MVMVNLKIEWIRIMIIFLEKTPNHTSKPIKKELLHCGVYLNLSLGVCVLCVLTCIHVDHRHKYK